MASQFFYRIGFLSPKFKIGEDSTKPSSSHWLLKVWNWICPSRVMTSSLPFVQRERGRIERTCTWAQSYEIARTHPSVVGSILLTWTKIHCEKVNGANLSCHHTWSANIILFLGLRATYYNATTVFTPLRLEWSPLSEHALWDNKWCVYCVNDTTTIQMEPLKQEWKKLA